MQIGNTIRKLTKKNLFEVIKMSHWDTESQGVILDMLHLLNPKWEQEMYDWMIENEVLSHS